MSGLPDVTITILDGGLGLAAAGNAGLHAKVGVSSTGTINEVVTISDPDKITEKFGTGPLADVLFDSFATGARTIYAVRASGDVAGTIGAVTSTKTGTGSIAVTGAPLDTFDLVVEILDSGQKNVATFHYSLDGGDTFSGKITVPTALTYAIPNSGLTLTFTEDAVTPASSFKQGDKYTCKTVAPQASVNSASTAIDALLNSGYQYEFIHLVGTSDAAMWAALSSKATTAEGRYRYIHFLAEARGPSDAETIDQWVTALQTAKASFASTRVSICAGRLEITDMATGRSVDRNGAGIYAGRVSAIPIKESPGKVMEGSLSAAQRLNPLGINDGQIQALDEAGFITFRKYIGLAGIYITNGRMAAEATSDFRYVELRRPMDKACAQVRIAGLKQEHAEIDPTNLEKSLATLEAVLADPLDEMVRAGEIARGRVVIPRDQDVLGTSTIRTKVRIVPLAIMRWIENEIGFENPFQS